MTTSIPRYGEQVTSFEAIATELKGDGNLLGQIGDRDAVRCNHLRGLIMGQASETERVLVHILHKIAPTAVRPAMTAGTVLKAIRNELPPACGSSTARSLDRINAAIGRRNRAVHDHLSVVYLVAPPPAPGEPAGQRTTLTYLGGEQVSEADLLTDLAAQQDATRAAVQIWIDLDT